MRQREKIKIGKTDTYPETDKYIPDACQEADQVADKSTQEWSNAFIDAMNTILSEKGLRVL